MARAVIAYDKDLPEIPGRRPWEKPTSYLIKDDATATGWREETAGRRPSRLLLVPKIRAAVDAWRAGGYEGASDVTQRLFEYWFDEDHEVPGFGVPFRYYFCQREAIETLVWLVEIAGQRDTQKLIQAHATIFEKDLLTKNITLQTTMDGRRQLRRYVPELDTEGLQDLPPEDLRRFAFKMATGSGKTWVIAMAVVWARFHKQRVPGSELSTNFLIVAPNVIVFQRPEKDFGDNGIFNNLPLVPPEWGKLHLKVIKRGEAAEPDPSLNLFLTNVDQLHLSRDKEWTPQNAIEALLGKKPAQDLASSGQRSMLERLKSLKDLVVMNDEAHHVHDEDLQWSQSLLSIHRALPKGLALWLDFSATPKDQNGMYFPWTVCDYPLAQAVEDRIVKAPLIVTKEDDPKQPKDDPEGVTADNIGEKYGYWLCGRASPRRTRPGAPARSRASAARSPPRECAPSSRLRLKTCQGGGGKMYRLFYGQCIIHVLYSRQPHPHAHHRTHPRILGIVHTQQGLEDAKETARRGRHRLRHASGRPAQSGRHLADGTRRRDRSEPTHDGLLRGAKRAPARESVTRDRQGPRRLDRCAARGRRVQAPRQGDRHPDAASAAADREARPHRETPGVAVDRRIHRARATQTPRQHADRLRTRDHDRTHRDTPGRSREQGASGWAAELRGHRTRAARGVETRSRPQAPRNRQRDARLRHPAHDRRTDPGRGRHRARDPERKAQCAWCLTPMW